MRKSKLQEAINKALKIYYQSGYTRTANLFKKELNKNIQRHLKRK
jgi:hypothetical protein